MKIKLTTTISILLSTILLSCNINSTTDFKPIKIDKNNLTKEIKTNLSLKVKLPKFNLKTLRKTSTDVSSIRVYLSTSNTPATLVSNSVLAAPIVINLNTLKEQEDTYTIQLTNVGAGGPLYAGVEAFDQTNATGNNITKINSSVPISVSTNSVTITSSPPNLTYSFTPANPEYLTIDLNLSDSLNHANDNLFSNTTTANPIRHLDLKTDNLGNGTLAWIESSASDILKIHTLKEYMEESTTVLTTNLTNPADKLSLDLNNKGEGIVFYNSFVGGITKDIRAMSFTNYGGATSSELIFASKVNKQMNNPQVIIDNKGDGLAIWTADKDVVKTNIYGRKITNYSLPSDPFGDGMSLYREDTLNHTNPRMSLNEKGSGMMVWNEDMPLNPISQRVYALPMINYDVETQNASGTITITNGSTNITGASTFFKSELEAGTRIIIPGQTEELELASTPLNDNNGTLTVRTTPSFNYTGAFSTKAGLKKLAGTLDLTSGNTSLSNSAGTNFTTDLKKDQRIRVFPAGGGAFDLVVSAVNANSGSNALTFYEGSPPGGPFNGASYAIKGDFLVSQNMHPSKASFPNIKLDESGTGVISWKSDPTNGGIFSERISMRKVDTKQILPANTINSFSFTFGSCTTSIFNDANPPSIILSPDGSGLVSLASCFTGTTGRADASMVNFLNYGATINSPMRLNTAAYNPSTDAYYPILSLNYSGHGIATWLKDSGTGKQLFFRHILNKFPN